MASRVVRVARAIVLTSVSLGGLAGTAQAATLNLRVSPKVIHQKGKFQIAVGGTYKRSELRGKAYLLSFIQYNLKPCKANATLELKVSGSAYRDRNAGRSPFGFIDGFKAGIPGRRRVCAYLYPSPIIPGDTSAPLQTATTTYNVRKTK